MPIKSYRDLEAWQLGMTFVLDVYRVTTTFPREELYGLSSQLRRAAISVPSNISEGHQRGTKAYKHFVSVALGSLAEVDTQLEIAARLKYASAGDCKSMTAQCARIRQVLHGLRRSLIAREQPNA
jgi:four helix bundle protein